MGKKQGPHSLFSQTGNLPSSSCVSIRIFNLTSQIDIECVVSWATWRSLHGVGFHRIEDHGVTLLTVASWRGDLELLHRRKVISPSILTVFHNGKQEKFSFSYRKGIAFSDF
jgi:hypothetical protein